MKLSGRHWLQMKTIKRISWFMPSVFAHTGFFMKNGLLWKPVQKQNFYRIDSNTFPWASSCISLKLNPQGSNTLIRTLRVYYTQYRIMALSLQKIWYKKNGIKTWIATMLVVFVFVLLNYLKCGGVIPHERALLCCVGIAGGWCDLIFDKN